MTRKNVWIASLEMLVLIAMLLLLAGHTRRTIRPPAMIQRQPGNKNARAQLSTVKVKTI